MQKTFEIDLENLDRVFDAAMIPPKPDFSVSDLVFKEHSEPVKLCTDPLVSVKVMTYNHGDILARALTHILEQQVKFPYEILITDDCSSDNTRQVAETFLQNHPETIRYVRTESNVTAKKNNRIGELLARGSYIAICEGDDYWHDPNKLQSQVNIFDKNPECVVVHSRVRNQTGFGNQATISSRERAKPPGMQSNVTDSLLNYEYGVHNCSSIYRRHALENAIEFARPLIDSTQFIHGDVPRYLALSRQGAFFLMDEETATYQINEESLSQSKSFGKRMRIKIHATMIRYWFARLLMEDTPKAKSILISFLNSLFRKPNAKLRCWASDKLKCLGAKPSLLDKMMHSLRNWI